MWENLSRSKFALSQKREDAFMEYAKDIVLNLKSGQEVNKRDWRRTRNRRRNTQKVGIFSKTLGKLLRHKIITTVMVVTIGFMAIDIYLVTSFVNVLGKI